MCYDMKYLSVEQEQDWLNSVACAQGTGGGEGGGTGQDGWGDVQCGP